MNAVRKRIKPQHFAAFLLPIVIFIVSYIVIGVWPFGDRMQTIIDSYHQYVPFFTELHDKLVSGGSLLYSWHGGLGYNFAAVSAYYLSSPLNFIIALFPDEMMGEAFELIILLKLGFASLFAYIYLSTKEEQDSWKAVVFAGFYSLCGFFVAYNWNVMWLDSAALLPLVVLGARRLLSTRDCRLYIVSFGLTVFCNYYIAIMVGIFMVLYFFAFRIIRRLSDSFLTSGLRYLGATALGTALGAVCLLPAYFASLNSSTGSSPKEIKLYADFADLAKQLFVLRDPTQLDGNANIYCGIFIVFMAVLFAFSKRLPLRERLVRLILTAFVFISFNVNVLDYVWHGFHFPNDLPGRFSFIFAFLMIDMAYDAFKGIRVEGRSRFIISAVIAAALFVCAARFGEEEAGTYSLALTAVLLGVYILITAVYRRKGNVRAFGLNFSAAVICLSLMAAELAANTIYGTSINGSTSRSSYFRYTSAMQTVRSEYEPQDDEFYRMEISQMSARNDVVRYHLNGLSIFSSTCDDRLEDLMDALGLYQAGNKFSYKGATPVTNAMTGIRYVAGNKSVDWPELEYINYIDDTEYVYLNKYDLSVGFMVPEQILDWTIMDGDPFAVQNEFMSLASGISGEDAFTMLETAAPEISGGTISMVGESKWRWEKNSTASVDGEKKIIFSPVFTEEQYIYVYFEASHSDSLIVVKDGQKTTYSDEKGHIVCLGKCGPETVITLEFPMKASYSNGTVKLLTAAFDEEAFANMYREIADSQMEIISADDRSISGKVTADEDGILMLSVPADDGWTALVDGEKTDPVIIGGALTGISLAAGGHTVELRYTPPGFRAGLAVSIAAAALTAAYFWGVHKKKFYAIMVRTLKAENMPSDNSEDKNADEVLPGEAGDTAEDPAGEGKPALIIIEVHHGTISYKGRSPSRRHSKDRRGEEFRSWDTCGCNNVR
ncbi:MAG: YfhO family protein [Lachnospiraceae bacterium]|nr:YfhO family protein [Lachnospiraceae bacterium]